MADTLKKTILLVEDEVILAMEKKMTLERGGYAVDTVQTGEEAIKAVRESKAIDLIMMDIDLGEGLDGTETAALILKLRDIPIVFWSSHTESEIVAKTNGIEAYGYIVKNSGDSVMSAFIRMALNLFDARQTGKKTTEALKISEDALLGQNRLFASLLETLPIGVLMVEVPSGKTLFSNAEAARLWGKSSPGDPSADRTSETHTAYKAGTHDLYPPEEMPLFLGMRGINAHVDDMVVERNDGSHALLEVFGSPVSDAGGQVHSCLISLIDITERKQTSETVLEIEDRFQALYDSSSDPLLRTDPRGDGLDAKTDAAAYNGELTFIGSGGKEFPGEIATCFIIDKNGFVRKTKKLLDITERKQIEKKTSSLLEEKELILKEVHHRIKNNMNTICCLLSLQAQTLTDEHSIAALDDAVGRVKSMAMLYDKLYQSIDFRELPAAEYLSPLIDQITANFPNAGKVQIDKQIDDFSLSVKKLQPVGIIVNELLTNIMKYAFTGKSDGHISVIVTLGGPTVSVIVADNGNGIPDTLDFEKSTGFGLVLVGGLTKQLNGKIRIDREHGTKIILEFKK